MRTLLISDLHRKDPRNLIDSLRNNISRLIALGDYDSPEILEYLVNLDIPKIILPGNHDLPLFDDALKLKRNERVNINDSPDYLPYGFKQYWTNVEKIVSSSILLNLAKKYYYNKNFDYQENSNLYCHSSIFDYDSDQPYQLWQRLQDGWFIDKKEVIKGNFMNMKKRNVSLFFRGHDHTQRVLIMDNSDESKYGIIFHRDNKEITFPILEDKRYIINVGAFQVGMYTIYDSEKNIITFFNPDSYAL